MEIRRWFAESTLSDSKDEGFPAETIRVLKESYRIVYRSNLNTKQAVEELEKSFGEVAEARELIAFIEKSERGIIR